MPRRLFITGVVIVLYLLSTLSHTSHGQTAQTQNIPPDVDLSVVGFHQTPLHNLTDLYVGDFGNVPFISYLRFNLSSIQTSDPLSLTTVSHTMVLRLLAAGPIQYSTNRAAEPRQNSTNRIYIVTVALADCKNPYWKVEGWSQTCPLSDVDTSTEDSVLITDSSLPKFYDWTVTSAVAKALPKGEVTLRVTGYTLNVKGFNGGVMFWNKETTSYYGNLFAGPPMLTVTTTTAPSSFANSLYAVAAAATIFVLIIGAVKGLPRIIRRWSRQRKNS